jgi:hypothetical protein
MFSKPIENIIYSYIRQVNCLKNKKINIEIKQNLELCNECNEHKLILNYCELCNDNYCISCTYKNQYYINKTEYLNNNIIYCSCCQDDICFDHFNEN